MYSYGLKNRRGDSGFVHPTARNRCPLSMILPGLFLKLTASPWNLPLNSVPGLFTPITCRSLAPWVIPPLIAGDGSLCAAGKSKTPHALTELDYLHAGPHYLSLSIDMVSREASLETSLSVIDEFRLKKEKAVKILENVQSAVRAWKSEARLLSISRREIDSMASAFERAE